MPEQRRLYNSIDEFRKAEVDADDPIYLDPVSGEVGPPNARHSNAIVRASFDTDIKAADDPESRSLLFSISSEAVDRMGDTIAVDGWKLDAYRKNPVVLWAHDSSSLPVAKSPRVWIEDKRLKAEAEFTPAGLLRFNDAVFDMIKGGFLSATSVGFAPHKYAFADDPARKYGIDFIEQELLEFSIVPVPANAEALIEGKAAGIDVAAILDWSEAALNKLADPSRIERLAESVLGKKNNMDPGLLGWAKHIIEKSGGAVVTRERVENIERAAKMQRLKQKRERELNLIRLGVG